MRSSPNVSSGLVSAASVAAYDAFTLRAGDVPPPIALAFTKAGRLAMALARLGSIAARTPRSVMADWSDSIWPDSAAVAWRKLEFSSSSARWFSYSPATSLLAFHAAPKPIRTGNVTTAPTTMSTGPSDSRTLRSSPSLSATTIVYRQFSILRQ